MIKPFKEMFAIDFGENIRKKPTFYKNEQGKLIKNPEDKWLDYVEWSCEESGLQGTLTVADGAWSETIWLDFGVNTIIVDAYDATGNTAQDTVVITQTNPTSTISGAAIFQ